MKTEPLFRYIAMALVVLTLFVGSVQSQEVQSQPAPDPAEPEYILAQPPYTMNYQGYLTDSGGNPLDGTYDLAFRLYDAPTGGNLEWAETHDNTIVTRGLFQVTLGSSTALLPDIFNQALYLAVWVDSTEVTPRQPLRAVPYAFGLVPGAMVEGDPSDTNYALAVRNSGGSATDRGLYARGNEHGVYAMGTNGAGLYANSSYGPYAIYSENATYSEGGYAGPDTYIWVPVHNAVFHYLANEDYIELEIRNYGEVQVKWGPSSSSSIVGDLYIPLQVEIPYGRSYRLIKAEIFYKVSGDAAIMSAYIEGRDFDGGAELTIGSNTAAGGSSSIASYVVPATSHTTIDTSEAPVGVEVTCILPDSGSIVHLYGLRLQLESID